MKNWLDKYTEEIPIAQNGEKVKQELFQKKNGGSLYKYQDGGIIKDDEGYRNPDNWGKDVEIDQSYPNSFIDMSDVYEPLKAIADTGEQRIMYPGEKHKFKGAKKVIEKPLGKGKNGLRQEQKSLQNLDQLTNFTNYNKKQPGGWLDKHN
jgi:hypothetical protein